jgi:hypothetical protein
MKKRTLREALEKDLGLKPKQVKALFEGIGMQPELKEDETPEMGEVPGYDDHLGQAVSSIFHDEELSMEEKKKKILALLKIVDAEESEEEEPKEEKAKVEESEEDEAKKMEEGEDCKESREQRLRFLERKDRVRDLCESEQFQPSKIQLKALLALDNDKEVKAFIQEAKEQRSPAAPKRTVAPRTGSQIRRETWESRELPEKVEDFAKALLN